MKKTSLRHPIPVKFVASFYFSRVSVSTGEKDKTNEKKKNVLPARQRTFRVQITDSICLSFCRT